MAKKSLRSHHEVINLYNSNYVGAVIMRMILLQSRDWKMPHRSLAEAKMKKKK